jgi:hypothetical protein
MPHPARPSPGPPESPWFPSGRDGAAGPAGGEQARACPGACTACPIRCCLAAAAPARRARWGGRSAGARGFRDGAIRAVRGGRAVPRRPPPPAAPLPPPPGRRTCLLETRFRRFLVAGG